MRDTAGWPNGKPARLNAPGAVFVQADMASVAFRPASFAGVVAFYSLIHVPRILSTARKHGINPLVALRQLFQGRPWLPAPTGC